MTGATVVVVNALVARIGRIGRAKPCASGGAGGVGNHVVAGSFVVCVRANPVDEAVWCCVGGLGAWTSGERLCGRDLEKGKK